MADKEFYAQLQYEWFYEFKEQELSEIRSATDVHIEFFEFDDVPF